MKFQAFQPFCILYDIKKWCCIEMKLIIHEHKWCIKKQFQLWLKYNDYMRWQDLPKSLPHFGGFYAGCWWNISNLLDVYCRTAIVIHIDVIHILGIFQEHLNFVGMQGELTDEWSSVFLERHVRVGNFILISDQNNFICNTCSGVLPIFLLPSCLFEWKGFSLNIHGAV